jgi:hypothetical protein
VADGAHDRHLARGETPYHPLVVERHEVVDGSAAAAHDQHVQSRITLDSVDGADDAVRRIVALNQRGRKHQPGSTSPKRHRANVVERRARSARDDPDDARLGRQVSLAPGIEQPFGSKPLLQSLERLEQCATTRGTHALGDELQSAARRPERRSAPKLDPRPFGQMATRSHRAQAVEHAFHGGVLTLVLEREVRVSARCSLERSDLPFHPLRSRRRFDGALEASSELGHADDRFGR